MPPDRGVTVVGVVVVGVVVVGVVVVVVVVVVVGAPRHDGGGSARWKATSVPAWSKTASETAKGTDVCVIVRPVTGSTDRTWVGTV
jgi:hypothetical protein